MFAFQLSKKKKKRDESDFVFLQYMWLSELSC